MRFQLQEVEAQRDKLSRVQQDFEKAEEKFKMEKERLMEKAERTEMQYQGGNSIDILKFGQFLGQFFEQYGYSSSKWHIFGRFLKSVEFPPCREPRPRRRASS